MRVAAAVFLRRASLSSRSVRVCSKNYDLSRELESSPKKLLLIFGDQNMVEFKNLKIYNFC